MEIPGTFSGGAWNPELPRTLVVACSDGRIHAELDAFMSRHLGIQSYDRLYMPGGPGALLNARDVFRAGTCQRAYDFLVAAHGIQQVVLIFHGAAQDGPEHAVCGDYRRQLPFHSPSELRAAQERDGLELFQVVRGWPGSPPVRVLHAEVAASGQVRFVETPRLPGNGQSPPRHLSCSRLGH
jgi:hypothetical protein